MLRCWKTVSWGRGIYSHRLESEYCQIYVGSRHKIQPDDPEPGPNPVFIPEPDAYRLRHSDLHSRPMTNPLPLQGRAGPGADGHVGRPSRQHAPRGRRGSGCRCGREPRSSACPSCSSAGISVRWRIIASSSWPNRSPVRAPIRLGALAKELGVVIIASLFEKRAEGLYHNTTAILDADGKYLGKYRKMHIPDDPQLLREVLFHPG